MPAEHQRRGEWLAPALLLVLGAVHLALYWWPFEDLYITLRYARNLAEGAGLRFNPGGEVVDGFTSFGWVLVAAAIERAALPADLTLKLVSSGAGLALAALCYQQCRRRAELGPLPAALVSAILVAGGPWAFWTMTGMEAVSFALLVAVAAVLAVRALDGHRGSELWSGLVMGAAMLLRPEGMGYALAIAAALAIFDWRKAARLALMAAAIFLPYFVWHWIHFGHPLPNTYYAKASASTGLVWRGVQAVEEFATSQMMWVPMIGAGWAAWTRRRRPWAVVLFAVALAAFANVVLVGGDTFLLYRFQLPGLVPLLVLFAASLADLQQWLQPRSSRPALWPPILAAALAIWALAATVRPTLSLSAPSEHAPRDNLKAVAELHEHYVAIGRWLRDSVPPDTVIATNAAGIIPYESRLPTIDLLGLNDSHIAHLDIELGHGTAGHEKHDADYVLDRSPDIVLLGFPRLVPDPPRSGRELSRYLETFFPYLPGDRALYLHPEFRRRYVPRAVPIAGRWLPIFVRRDRLVELMPR